MLEFTCCFCMQRTRSNPKLKCNQHYCSKAECQRARKRDWKNKRMLSDEGFREKQIKYIKQWRREKPAHQYMSSYRQDHPEYVEMNRQKQRERNLAGRGNQNQGKAEKIVKVDALILSPTRTNTYQMTSFRKDSLGKIVKVDTLMVQLKQIQALNLLNPVFIG